MVVKSDGGCGDDKHRQWCCATNASSKEESSRIKNSEKVVRNYKRQED